MKFWRHTWNKRSRDKLVHNKLKASLSAEKLDNQLFVRYNFKTILKITEDVEIANNIEVLPFDDSDLIMMIKEVSTVISTYIIHYCIQQQQDAAHHTARF